MFKHSNPNCLLLKQFSVFCRMAALQTNIVEHVDNCGYGRNLFVDQNAATIYQCGMLRK